LDELDKHMNPAIGIFIFNFFLLAALVMVTAWAKLFERFLKYGFELFQPIGRKE
jgi:hypothetical protein